MPASGPSTLTAVVGAMREEVERLEATLLDTVMRSAGPFAWLEGRLEGHRVLLAECGIGKVNAAALTQALLSAGATRLLFTGVAGAVHPDLRVGDVVISSDAVQHDVDVTGLGYQPGEVPGVGKVWHAAPELVEAARAAAAELDLRVMVGRVASGDTFVADVAATRRLSERFDALCTEMEGAAVAQVCHRWRVPFVIVRSISDSADHSANVDFRAFTQVAAATADRVVRGTLKRLP